MPAISAISTKAITGRRRKKRLPIISPFTRANTTSQHFRENENTGELEALTPAGAFHVRLLHLNRPPLVAHRPARRAVEVMQQRVKLLEARVEQREQTIQFLLAYIDLMNRLIAVTLRSED
ncbi:MAG TPA: hypothetical protein VNQ79_03195 [Blastocatellia bacterium]|nr:hypothetical protein [Blastocatellia bacterium]